MIGVGMTKFEKPGTKEGDYPDWAKEAGDKALADAGIPYEDVEQAYAGYCYGDSTYGQRALYQLGLTGIPVVNVNNNCSTGSSALFLARQAVKGGLVDCALALGFEKMEPGSLGVKYTDRTNALDRHLQAMIAGRGGWEEAPPAPKMFGNAGRIDQLVGRGVEFIEGAGAIGEDGAERAGLHLLEAERHHAIGRA